ncbi:MAG TPA: DUF2911 domain-containing protein [Terriglobales bacterium]|nr:DUF2911 domain-containing protein [Terriglobales bacterium]
MRAAVTVAVICLALISMGQAEDSQGQAPEGNAVCTFEDGQQVSVRYVEVPYGKSDAPRGKIWEPGKRPMYLFSQTGLAFGSQTVAPGAYSLYAIPGEHSWTLVLNSGVEQGKPYNASKDVAKLTAETGELSNSSNSLKLYFGRIAPTKCTLRVDYGKQRAFADFEQKK